MLTEPLDYSTSRLIFQMRGWEANPAGIPGLVKPAPEHATDEVIAERLSLTLTGTRAKIAQAERLGLIRKTLTGEWELTDTGRGSPGV